MVPDKPKIAFFDFTGCEGCQLAVIDALEDNPELLEVVEIVEFREAMSEKNPTYQIAFVEGSCSRLQDEARLLEIRQNADLVIALGACAHIGGVNSIRNTRSNLEIRRYVYGETGIGSDSYPACSIDKVIHIDGFIPGCPIDRKEFIKVVTQLLQKRKPQLPSYSVCFECKLKENACLILEGKPCLGPITRAGCGALCPTFSLGCDGCRGLITNPNIPQLLAEFKRREINDQAFEERVTIFLTNVLFEEKITFNVTG